MLQKCYQYIFLDNEENTNLVFLFCLKVKDIGLSSNEGSFCDYIPETASISDGSSANEDCPPDSEANNDWDHLIDTIRDSKPPHGKTAPTVSTKNCVEQQDTAATTS